MCSAFFVPEMSTLPSPSKLRPHVSRRFMPWIYLMTSGYPSEAGGIVSHRAAPHRTAPHRSSSCDHGGQRAGGGSDAGMLQSARLLVEKDPETSIYIKITSKSTSKSSVPRLFSAKPTLKWASHTVPPSLGPFPPSRVGSFARQASAARPFATPEIVFHRDFARQFGSFAIFAVRVY
jgi:hypothetical protein